MPAQTRSAPATKSNLQGSPLSRGQDVGPHFRARHGTGARLNTSDAPDGRRNAHHRRRNVILSRVNLTFLISLFKLNS